MSYMGSHRVTWLDSLIWLCLALVGLICLVLAMLSRCAPNAAAPWIDGFMDCWICGWWKLLLAGNPQSYGYIYNSGYTVAITQVTRLQVGSYIGYKVTWVKWALRCH